MASSSASVFLFSLHCGTLKPGGHDYQHCPERCYQRQPPCDVVLRVNGTKRVFEVAKFIFRGNSKQFCVPAVFGPCFTCPDVLKVRTRQAEWPRSP